MYHIYVLQHMAQLPESFDKAFCKIRTELVENIHVSSSLLNQLLNSGLLIQLHAEELKVFIHSADSTVSVTLSHSHISWLATSL